MNLSFPHLGISTKLFAFTVLIGIAPWNFFACSSGNLIKNLTSTRDIMGKEQYLQLGILCLIFLAIPFIKRIFLNRLNRANYDQVDQVGEE